MRNNPLRASSRCGKVLFISANVGGAGRDFHKHAPNTPPFEKKNHDFHGFQPRPATMTELA
jgi:hypothetical protein